jgi:hypothetical protein
MRVLEHAMVGVACGASAAISTLVLFLCSVWLLSSASLALVTMTALGSGLIALMEFRSSSRVQCRAQREVLESDCNIPARHGESERA